jgi:hypothetical protein
MVLYPSPLRSWQVLGNPYTFRLSMDRSSVAVVLANGTDTILTARRLNTTWINWKWLD